MAKTKNNDASTLDTLATEIKAEHEAVVQTVRKSLDHARKAGELLSKAKAAVIKDTDYQWSKWVENRCGIIERTASNYLRIYEGWAEIEAKLKDHGGELARLTVRGALGLLKTTTRPQPKREPLTLDTIKERMAQHHIQGDPAELVKLLKELGLRVSLADDEDEDDDKDDDTDEA